MPLCLSLFVGIMTGIFSGVFPSSFGLPTNGATVVQYPVVVNGIFFGCASACFMMLALCPLWAYRHISKTRPVAVTGGIMLVCLWVWMLMYPRQAILSAQIFTPVFIIAVAVLIAFIAEMRNSVALGLAIFAVSWLHILVFVVFQNTVTVNFLSQPVTFSSSVTIDGPLLLTGQNVLPYTNFTQSFVDTNYLFASVSTYLPVTNETADITIANDYFLSQVIMSDDGFFLGEGGGMWTGSSPSATLASDYIWTQGILFNTDISIGGPQIENFVTPSSDQTIPPLFCVKLDLSVTANNDTYVQSFNFLLALPDSVMTNIYVEGSNIVLKLCNISVDPVLIAANSIRPTVVTVEWTLQETNIICTLLRCSTWCNASPRATTCNTLGCCT